MTRLLIALTLLLAVMTTPATTRADDGPPQTDIGLPPLPPPTLTATWQGASVLAVTWRWAPPGSCLYLDGQFVPVPCGASGAALLPRQGVDTAYRPDPGDTLSLMRDETREVLASAGVPPFVVILPVVAAP